MVFRKYKQKDIPEDTASGIPSRIGALMADMYQDRVFAFPETARQVRPESSISVCVAADDFTVQQHIAVHINPVKG